MRGSNFKAHAGEYPPDCSAPAAGAFDAPLTLAGINSVWAGYVTGALDRWRAGCAWDDLDPAYQDLEQLIKFLGLVESGDDMPDVGDGKIFFGPESAIPSGWLLCNGAAISRATYADLFGVVGTAFGAGDGSTTFNLPDLRGRFPLGRDNMGGSDANTVTDPNAETLGGAGGAETHTLTVSEMASHTHSYRREPLDTQRGNGSPGRHITGDAYSTNTGSQGGNSAHNNLPPWLAINILIYAGV